MNDISHIWIVDSNFYVYIYIYICRIQKEKGVIDIKGGRREEKNKEGDEIHGTRKHHLVGGRRLPRREGKEEGESRGKQVTASIML